MATRTRRRPNSALPTTRQRSLRSTQDESIVGNLVLSDYAQVGGDFTVYGDLTVNGPVLCLGRLTVHGRLDAATVVAGLGLDVSEDIDALCIYAFGPAVAPDWILDEAASEFAIRSRGRMPMGATIDNGLSWIVDAQTLDEIRENATSQDVALSVGGNCFVQNEMRAVGKVAVAGRLRCKELFCDYSELSAGSVVILGSMSCGGNIAVAGNLLVEGFLETSWSVDAAGNGLDGNLRCLHLEVGTAVTAGSIMVLGEDYANAEDEWRWSLECDGELKAEAIASLGSISAGGAITCSFGNLRADGSVQSGRIISVEDGFAVFAGLGASSGGWLEYGYVTAKVEPKALSSGVFRPLARTKRGEPLRPKKLTKHSVWSSRR